MTEKKLSAIGARLKQSKGVTRWVCRRSTTPAWTTEVVGSNKKKSIVGWRCEPGVQIGKAFRARADQKMACLQINGQLKILWRLVPASHHPSPQAEVFHPSQEGLRRRRSPCCSSTSSIPATMTSREASLASRPLLEQSLPAIWSSLLSSKRAFVWRMVIPPDNTVSTRKKCGQVGQKHVQDVVSLELRCSKSAETP